MISSVPIPPSSSPHLVSSLPSHYIFPPPHENSEKMPSSPSSYNENTEKDDSPHPTTPCDDTHISDTLPMMAIPNCNSLSSLPTKISSSLRIVFQNVHGLPWHNRHPKNDSLRCFVADNNIDVFGMSEVNIDWQQHVPFHE